ncbi:MAG: hypothetical protein KA085_09215 [Phenylobacterium sp.]|uniref:hypothetical protein n=1 Tax=Phenylobacterium sp. TaxID=1871053 RepID=UPI001B62E7D0|nr:hypothetical protein [Phenylobacterium sp.]MBP7816293.1 hypothetical protein [Phenylobacterium sp.]MBP9232588.1 hypothetical protein [Phenylobacterium sp.]MBP9754647.1 hypothetical protein [Phenylobacterium sp.]
MLTEARQDFLIELRGYDGGLGLMPCPPSVPKAHRFQGGLIYSRMIEIEGRVVAPEGLAGRRMRIWLDQLESWHFSQGEPPHIGDICDRAGELPGGGLETTLHIPKDAWPTAVSCLGTVWRRLNLTGADGDGRSMRLIDFSFSSDGAQLP